jgi:hypothetical protein
VISYIRQAAQRRFELVVMRVDAPGMTMRPVIDHRRAARLQVRPMSTIFLPSTGIGPGKVADLRINDMTEPRMT